MILSDLKQYLLTNKVASLHELTVAFRVEPDVIRAMLQHWIQKGLIEKHSASDVCGGSCRKCDPLLREIYAMNNEE